MSASLQNEFPLRIPICAWCKPKNRGVELGTGLGVISHGICPRHLKKLRLELQKDSAHAVHAITDTKDSFVRLDVNITGFFFDGSHDDGIDHFNDGNFLGRFV